MKPDRKQKHKYVIRTVFFTLIAGLMFQALNWFLQPVWLEWNNYDTVYGFYEQPRNTIDTVFLGASITANGFIPMELYETYGICAYNLGTEQQPVLVSYYWLEEAYRLHSKTLKTVVLDCSMLRKTPKITFYQKGIDGMALSRVKINAVWAYTKNADEALSYLFPLFAYHSIWSSLTKSDFLKRKYDVDHSSRGYHFTAGQYIDSGQYDLRETVRYLPDPEAEDTQFDPEALAYFEKMVEFCREKGLTLTLAKTPVLNRWSSSDHHAVAAAAETYGLDFFDFNYAPWADEIDYNRALDSEDGLHMNYYGASKLTAWFGNYLSENCGAADVRKDPGYDYMEELLKEYHASVEKVLSLKRLEDPCAYIKTAIKNQDNMVFLAVKDEASKSLTPEQRKTFASLGLKKLSKIRYRDSYLAVIENGDIVCELLERNKADADDTEDIFEDADFRKLAVSYEGNLKDGTAYQLKGGGRALGNIASCKIDGKEYAKNHRGLNMVVYDARQKKCVDSAYFDTFASDTRDNVNMAARLEEELEKGKDFSELSANLQKLYLYNRRCEAFRYAAVLKEQTGSDGLWDYLKAYWDKQDCVIFLSALDDAAGALDATARAVFEANGLHELAALEYRDSYLAVVEQGQVIYEKKDHGRRPIETDGIIYRLKSGGFESGNISSIQIWNAEYSQAERGINIAVYDRQLNEVIDTASFDTCVAPVHITKQEEVTGCS